MRYLFGFLWIFVFLLLPFIACGDWLEGPDSPCEGVNCNDGNPCTDDSCTHDCSSPTCVHDPVKNGTGCSLRGASGVCINGVCDLCAGVVCEDDGNECIDDVCRAYTGTCGVPADNGTVCEYKGILPGFCASGFCAKSLCEDGTCDDGNECTDDVCDPLARRCSYIPLENYTGCDLDGLSGVCLDGLCGEDLCEGVACDDQNPCTDDTCDYADGTCDFFAVEDGANCDFDGFRSICISGVCQPECESPEDCDNENDCTEDLCVDGTCELVPVTDGTACGDDAGTCQDGSCEVACTEQGIRDAIAAGGGPYTFDCADGMTVVTTAEIEIDNDVILDGEGNLIVDGGGAAPLAAGEVAPKVNGAHRVFSIPEGATVELIGFIVTGGATTEAGGGILNAGTLTLANSIVSGNTASFGGGIRNEGEGRADVIETTVSDNFATQAGGGISNRLEGATMTLSRSTVQGNTATGNVGGIGNSGMLTVTNTTVSGNEAGDEGGGMINYAGGTAVLSGISVSMNTAPVLGGGVSNRPGANMTLTDSTISGNVADRGGGVSNSGQATLTNNTVSSNSAGDWDGGGILNLETGTLTVVGGTVSENTAVFGAGIRNWSQAEVVDVTVSNNIAANAGGGFSNRLEGATMTITGSTVVGNIAETGGSGGIGNSGTLTVINTTVSGNQSALSGAAIGNSDAAWPLRLVSSTLFGNVAPPGRDVVFSRGSFTARNSIIEGQCAFSHVISLGGNIESPGNTCLFPDPADQVFVTLDQLKLGPLADNGGPTMTHAPQSSTNGEGSVAIDQIPVEDCVDAEGAPLMTDQRGFPRDSMCDIGAFEVQP